MPPRTSPVPQPIVTPRTMGRIDAAAIGSGIEGYRLMLTAGSAISACVLAHYPGAAGAIILCGPGNNGGDGYVAARYLADAGMPVLLYSSVQPERLKGDAARACADWRGPVYPIKDLDCGPGHVVVDALFGAGLDRPIEGSIAEIMQAVAGSGLPVVAADLPSGISGRTGQVQGISLQAEHTVTFAALKPGHLLLPGAAYCGETQLVDIGIPGRVIEEHTEAVWRNDPAAWNAELPMTGPTGHKYTRGHLCVFSGSFSRTGAARLAAHSALKSGAGLVTVLSPSSAIAANASHLTAIMLRKVDDREDLDEVLVDRRMGGFVLGPGFGIVDKVREFALGIVKAGRSCVLDADAISAFSECPDALFSACRENPVCVVLTPHDGEFARLFHDLHADPELSKIDRARQAAQRCNAVVLYKGADTVIAAPDGRAVINDNGPPWLATAGSGDCLAGIVGALLVQRMSPFEAAAAAAFLHGEAGKRAGEGLTADDLPDAIPSLSQYQSDNQRRG